MRWEDFLHFGVQNIVLNAGEGVGKRKPSYTAGGIVNLYSHYEKRKEVPKKTKYRVAIWSNNPTPGHLSRGNSNYKRCTLCAQEHCLQLPRQGSN